MEVKIGEVEKKCMNKLQTFESKILEVEKNTLWKIKDCEELLKIRVNEGYVSDVIKKSEDKMIALVI